MVLAVDNSAHWFNIGLYTIKEDGIIDPIERFVHEPRIDKQAQLDALKHELEDMLAKPSQIRHLLVYGEQAENLELLALLSEKLGSELVDNARLDSSVWTGVSYMAEAAHIVMDDVQIEMDPGRKGAFGCKWRSKLYREDREEL